MIHPDLPLVELHRHLDGAVRLETILDLALQHNLPLPARKLEQLRPHIQITTPQPGVMEFIARMTWMTSVMVDYAAIRRIAYENVEDVKREGLDYAELRFSPWFMAESHHLEPSAVVEAVIDGVTQGQRDFEIPIALIGILSRTYGPFVATKELSALLAHASHITAIDLAGDEANFPATWFTEHFRQARDRGLHVTVHAGENAGPDSIWQAIHSLGAERIGHGIKAEEDPDLLDFLARSRIGIESCLTSNVQTSCVPDYPSHPLKTFLEHGILAGINTDDPGISAITLSDEYNLAAPLAGLSAAQTRQAQINSLESSFLSPDEIQNLRDKKFRHLAD